MLHFLQYLQDSAYADWVREGWGWALALTIHAFGNATVVGLIFIMGLRLFGFFRTIPLNSIRAFFPFIWVGVACQVLSGATLWLTKPVRYVADGVFDVKFSMVVLGVLSAASVILTRWQPKRGARLELSAAFSSGRCVSLLPRRPGALMDGRFLPGQS